MNNTLDADAKRKIQQTTVRLDRIHDQVHVWVRDARRFPHGEETSHFFSLTLFPSLPIAELRDMIQSHVSTDAKLSLLFHGNELDDHKSFGDYLPPRTPWPRPFVGVIWILPFRALQQTIAWYSIK